MPSASDVITARSQLIIVAVILDTISSFLPKRSMRILQTVVDKIKGLCYPRQGRPNLKF